MKLLTIKEVHGVPPNTLIEGADLSPGELRRLFSLGFLVRPTTVNLRNAAKARSLPGWHNMKHSTLLERLNGESDTD